MSTVYDFILNIVQYPKIIPMYSNTGAIHNDYWPALWAWWYMLVTVAKNDIEIKK